MQKDVTSVSFCLTNFYKKTIVYYGFWVHINKDKKPMFYLRRERNVQGSVHKTSLVVGFLEVMDIKQII